MKLSPPIWASILLIFFFCRVYILLKKKSMVYGLANRITKKFLVPRVLDWYASFVEKNPYETRNTNLISLDVATKL